MINDFFNKWNNKKIDFDHAFGSTCVDLYRQYCQELGFTQSPPVNGAAEIWNTYLHDKFQAIPNTPLGVPQLGDIIIWSKSLNGYGHVAIFQSGNLWSFISFDQNWSVGSPCHFQKHNYKYVLGWLRPRPQTPVFPHIPLQIARIGLNLPPIGDFQAQVAHYSSNKITLTTNDLNANFTIPTSGMITQDDAYTIVDKFNIQQKFIFIFYPPNSTSAFYATYYDPQRDCCITTAPGMDAKLLTFEFAHQLQIWYNTHKGGNPPVEVIDSNFPSDELFFQKYNSVSGFYQ